MNEESREARIKRISQNVLSLPALPTIIAKMIELIDNPTTSASILSKLISTDQVMTAKILKLANSAFYGFPQRIATINLAIVVLGFDTLKEVGLSLFLVDRFKNRPKDPDFDMSLFWEHSIAVGVTGKLLAKQMRYKVVGEVFVAGLLHDLGKLILHQYFPKEFHGIMERVKEDNISFRQAELDELGFGHAVIGSWLAEKWKLPEQLTEAIKCHHTPAKAEVNPQLNALIHFADFLVKTSNIGYSGDRVIPRLNIRALEHLDVKMNGNEIDFAFYHEMITSELDNAETFINLIQGRHIPQQEHKPSV